MQEYLLYAIIALFMTAYFLRSVLMVGYEHFKFKSKREQAGKLFTDLISIIVSLKPLFQRRLTPKGYDFKVQLRYQKKFNVYYVVIWSSLFLILFLAARIYLDAF
ncbi:MAG TPA: hypothetical protein VFV46_12440 [Lacibacter sp.]|nr:hypothetical protein [Lacibacter sp.]